MSCAAAIGTFRLLDGLVGWDALAPGGMTGLTALPDDAGLVLSLTHAGAIDPAAVTPYLPPPRLARGCDPCDWYLATPRPSRLLVRGACAPAWTPIDASRCFENVLVNAVAIAVWKHFIAVSDPGAGTLWIFAANGGRLIAAVPLERADAVAFTPQGEIVVVAGSGVVRVSIDGRVKGVLPFAPPHRIVRIGVGRDCRVWMLTEPRRGIFFLWSAAFDDREPRRETADALASAFASLGAVTAGRNGFCLDACCYAWDGRCVDEADIDPDAAPARETAGELLTAAIDSGITACVWHRVRVDATIPAATTLQVSVATGDDQNTPPDPGDWKDAAAGQTDFLIRAMAGQFLHVRVRLTGDGTATPVLRRIRIDFPRVTSLDLLPLVYREEPVAEEFTERFLSLFDATVLDVDRIIERSPALLDPTGVPAGALPWLATFFDIALERQWDGAQRRAILGAMPELHRLRGTVAGLRRAIELVFGVAAHIEELGPTRNWGATGKTTVLGAVRVFSRSAARVRLGTSRVGRTPLRSYGDPDRDPDSANAFRIRVSTPSSGPFGAIDVAALQRLVESQKPAHVAASVVRTGERPGLAAQVAVGIDTQLVSLPKPILGRDGNIRLHRASIVWHGRRGRGAAMRTDRVLAAGINTTIE